ncbi:HAMP domain-containing sensor histidine kinase [Pseudoalteromonas piscicida]|uniref:sensor histidine kinase n=1 Tax=Pseudoalteromonas piscicida TaxID=43662 RepID=UPI0030AC64F7
MREIEISLRRYILIALFLLATAIIALLSYFWTQQFFKGLDGMMRGTMLNLASNYSVSGGEQIKVHNFLIAKHWQALPLEVQQAFSPTEMEDNQLYKKVFRENLWNRPSAAIFVMKFRQGEQTSFISHQFSEQFASIPTPWYKSPEAIAVTVALLAIAIFGSIVMMLMHTVTKPVNALHKWASALDATNLEEPPPQFKYKELSNLAHLIQQSLVDVNTSLKREQDFVRYASHELRTPIAIIRSSVELIDKISPPLPIKCAKALQRIDIASHEMATLSETLLWLSKTSKPKLDCQPIYLDQLIQSQVKALSYLIAERDIQISFNLSRYQVWLPSAAAKIVIGNLIRNAMQHTFCGTIEIHQHQNLITIKNIESIDNLEPQIDTLGYGLGLKLVEQLCQQLNWQCHIEFVKGGCYASVYFCKH